MRLFRKSITSCIRVYRRLSYPRVCRVHGPAEFQRNLSIPPDRSPPLFSSTFVLSLSLDRAIYNLSRLFSHCDSTLITVITYSCLPPPSPFSSSIAKSGSGRNCFELISGNDKKNKKKEKEYCRESIDKSPTALHNFYPIYCDCRFRFTKIK